MLRCVVLVRTDVSEERTASIIRVTRIGELGKTLAVTSSVRWLRSIYINGIIRVLLSLQWHFDLSLSSGVLGKNDGYGKTTAPGIYIMGYVQVHRNWTVALGNYTNKTNSVALSPQANYTDWATASRWRNLVPTFMDRGVSRGQRGGSPTVVNLSFLDRIWETIQPGMIDRSFTVNSFMVP
jgi:hypothetical protein